MTTFVSTANITTSDKEDKAVIKWAVDRENADRVRRNLQTTAQNAQIAAQDPPGTPLPLLTVLPTTTVGEYKTAYETYFLVPHSKNYQDSRIREYKEFTKNDASNREIIELLGEATQDKKNAVKALLEAP